MRTQLDRLAALPADELRRQWQRLYAAEPPRATSELLIRGIAQRMQENSQGRLDRAILRQLQKLRMDPDQNALPVPADRRLRPGTRLVRTWQGRTYVVVVTDDGFVFDGRSYTSLTRIACAITGTNWSGPKFFGLKQAGRRTS